MLTNQCCIGQAPRLACLPPPASGSAVPSSVHPQAHSAGPPSPSLGCGGGLDCKQSTSNLQGSSSTHPRHPPKDASPVAWAPLPRSICRKTAPARHGTGGTCGGSCAEPAAQRGAGNHDTQRSMGLHQPAGPICPQRVERPSLAAGRLQHASHGTAMCATAKLQHYLVLVKQQGAVVACKGWRTGCVQGVLGCEQVGVQGHVQGCVSRGLCSRNGRMQGR